MSPRFDVCLLYCLLKLFADVSFCFPGLVGPMEARVESALGYYVFALKLASFIVSLGAEFAHCETKATRIRTHDGWLGSESS